MSDIPDIDQRVRARILIGKDVEDLYQELDSFFQHIGLLCGDPNELEIWRKAILLVQDPKAFDYQKGRNYGQTDAESGAVPGTEATGENIPEAGLRPDASAVSNTNNDRTGGLVLNPMEWKFLELDRELERPDPDAERQRPNHDIVGKAHRRCRLFPPGNDWHKWTHLPWQQWRIIVLCALVAVHQGWTEAIINSAQTFYQPAFQKWITLPQNTHGQPAIGIGEEAPKIVGLINSAPYLACVISCWLSPFLNRKVGRRGAIFWSTVFSILSPLLQATSQNWWSLFISRLLAGLGIGPKSATMPVYLAEMAPASIRGSLVMSYQIFTAFGIMLGSFSGVALQDVGDYAGTVNCPLDQPSVLLSWSCSQNWRFMLGSPVLVATYLLFFTYGCVESPRWTIERAHQLRIEGRIKAAEHKYDEAWMALQALSRHRLIAARDMLSFYYLLDEERKDLCDRLEEYPRRSDVVSRIMEFFARRKDLSRRDGTKKHRRNVRAVCASLICMFAQQFCGVNIIVYYSNYIFEQSQPKTEPGAASTAVMARLITVARSSLYYTAGFGCINFFCATPALFLIDTVGRRSLLLCAFLFLGAFHFITMAGFLIPTKLVREALTFFGISMFGVLYSFTEGPVPFVYASESMPLYCRETAMAFVVSVNWLLNWVIAYTGPLMLSKLKAVGTFAFYGGMCIFCWFLILFFVPDTRLLTLEELGMVFEEYSAIEFATHSYKTLKWWLRGRKPGEKPVPLYHNLRRQTRVNNQNTGEGPRIERTATIDEPNLQFREVGTEPLLDPQDGHAIELQERTQG